MSEPVAPPHPSSYARYALVVLTAVSLFNFLDRQIIAILAEPIKRDLHLTDQQVGLMAGLSFAILYTTLSIPIAWAADRWRRPSIIALALAGWSAMTMACGAAANITQLLLARIGVGIGEAGSGPAAQSLLSDLFPPEKRAGAFGLYGLGVPIGAFVAYAGGGWLVEHVSWRAAFFAAGAPGILLALVVWLTVKEPRVHGPAAATSRGGFFSALNALSGKPTFWHLVAAGTLVAFVGFGFAAFHGAFFVRVHGMGYAELGLALGVMIGVAGAMGMWSGGVVADFFYTRSVAMTLVAPAIVLVVATPLFVLGVAADDKWIAIALLSAPIAATTFYYGPTLAGVQGLATANIRATAAAIFVLISSLIGMGLGPFFSGSLSDYLTARAFADAHDGAFAAACGAPAPRPDGCAAAEADGMRMSITILSLFSLWAAAHFVLAARTIKRDLAEPSRHLHGEPFRS